MYGNVKIPPGNDNELRDALLEEWNNIPQAQINNLIHSMRRRCQAVSNAAVGILVTKAKKKKKMNRHLPQMKLKNPMKLIIFRL